MQLLDADGLDLHQCAAGQSAHLHGGAGGILPLGEELGVYRVHGGEVAHVLQEHGGLDHVVHGEAGGLQNGLHIGQHLTGLLGDAAGHELTGGGVKGHLTGGDKEAAAVDGLRIGADGGRGVGGGDDLFHGVTLLNMIINAVRPEPEVCSAYTYTTFCQKWQPSLFTDAPVFSLLETVIMRFQQSMRRADEICLGTSSYFAI